MNTTIQELQEKVRNDAFEYSEHAVTQSILSYQENAMMNETWNERFAEQQAPYIVEIDGELVIIQHVPARVNTETGERFFAPATVEKIQTMLRSRQAPSKVIQAPVFEFAA